MTEGLGMSPLATELANHNASPLFVDGIRTNGISCRCGWARAADGARRPVVEYREHVAEALATVKTKVVTLTFQNLSEAEHHLASIGRAMKAGTSFADSLEVKMTDAQWMTAGDGIQAVHIIRQLVAIIEGNDITDKAGELNG